MRRDIREHPRKDICIAKSAQRIWAEWSANIPTLELLYLWEQDLFLGMD